MGICFSEPTIDELLDDSLTQGLMRADGVDAAALKRMLLRLASSIESRPALQHDLTAANRGIVAWGDPTALAHDPSDMATLPTAATLPSNPCVAC
jgi:hypothetical protein